MIYFIRPVSGGPILIGASARFGVRLSQLEWELGRSFVAVAVMDGSFDVERDLHGRFAAVRHAGAWFAPAEELLAFIATYSRPWGDRGSFAGGRGYRRNRER